MTGRQLIMFILQHKLENEPVFKDGRLLGFKTVDEIAVKLGVGTATVYAYVERGMLYSVRINDTLYIADDLLEMEEKRNEQ